MTEPNPFALPVFLEPRQVACLTPAPPPWRCESCKHFGTKPYDAEPEEGWGVCELAWSGGGGKVDPSGDNLFVRPDFGCVLYEAKP